MTKRPTVLERLVATAILLTVCIAVIVAVAVPIRAFFGDLDREIGLQSRLASRLAAGGANLETYRTALSETRTEIARDGRFIKADSQALAVAGLQRLVQSTISENGGTMRSVQDVEVLPDGYQRPVKVKVILTARYPDLVHILYQLETREPFLFVDALSVKSASRGQIAEQWLPLSVLMEVTAYQTPGATGPENGG